MKRSYILIKVHIWYTILDQRFLKENMILVNKGSSKKLEGIDLSAWNKFDNW